MYAGAAISAISLMITLVTVGSLRTAIHNATLADGDQYRIPLEIAAVVVAIVFADRDRAVAVEMARANKAGKNWARITATVFFGLDTLAGVPARLSARPSRAEPRVLAAGLGRPGWAPSVPLAAEGIECYFAASRNQKLACLGPGGALGRGPSGPWPAVARLGLAPGPTCSAPCSGVHDLELRAVTRSPAEDRGQRRGELLPGLVEPRGQAAVTTASAGPSALTRSSGSTGAIRRTSRVTAGRGSPGPGRPRRRAGRAPGRRPRPPCTHPGRSIRASPATTAAARRRRRRGREHPPCGEPAAQAGPPRGADDGRGGRRRPRADRWRRRASRGQPPWPPGCAGRPISPAAPARRGVPAADDQTEADAACRRRRTRNCRRSRPCPVGALGQRGGVTSFSTARAGPNAVRRSARTAGRPSWAARRSAASESRRGS